MVKGSGGQEHLRKNRPWHSGNPIAWGKSMDWWNSITSQYWTGTWALSFILLYLNWPKHPKRSQEQEEIWCDNGMLFLKHESIAQHIFFLLPSLQGAITNDVFWPYLCVFCCITDMSVWTKLSALHQPCCKKNVVLFRTYLKFWLHLILLYRMSAFIMFLFSNNLIDLLMI